MKGRLHRLTYSVATMLAVAASFTLLTAVRSAPLPSPTVSPQAEAAPPSPTPPASASSSPVASQSPSRVIALPVSPTPVPLDINDVSFLWPVPQTKSDVD